MQYFIKRGEKVQGPFTREQLMGIANAKKINGADLVGNSAQGPFEELKTVWDLIRTPSVVSTGAESVQPIKEPNPPTSVPAIAPAIPTSEPAPGQAAIQTGPPSIATSPGPNGKKGLLLIGGIAGGVLFLVAVVWILVASFRGSGSENKGGGGPFSTDPALLAEAGKRLQGVWITEIQKTETQKANLLESQTESTTTSHRVLTFRFFPPQNPAKGLYADGYFFRGDGASQKARITEMYGSKKVSQWLIAGELLAADPENPDHKQYILAREKEGRSSVEIVEARKNADGTIDLKMEWDQPDFIEYRGGTDKTNFYRKETAFVRNLGQKSNTCEIEWQDRVSKRFKDVEVLTDLPGIALFTRLPNPEVESPTPATSNERSSKVNDALEELRKEADRFSRGDFTPQEEKNLKSVMRELAKRDRKPVPPDPKLETAAESLAREVFDSIKQDDFEKFKANAVLTETEFVPWLDGITNHPGFVKMVQASGKSLEDVKGEMKYNTAFVGGPENVRSSFSKVREAAIQEGVNWEAARFLSVDTVYDLKKRPWFPRAVINVTFVDGVEKYCFKLDDAGYVQSLQSFKLFDDMQWRGTEIPGSQQPGGDSGNGSGRPRTLQEFGKRIFAAYRDGNESELMGLTATVDDYEKWILRAKRVVANGDFSRVDGRTKGVYEGWASASEEKKEKEKKEVSQFVSRGRELLGAALKSQDSGVAALLEGNASTKFEVVGDWKDAVFKKVHADPVAIDGKYDDHMFGFGIEFLLGKETYTIVFFAAGMRVDGEYFIFTIPKCFRKFKGEPPSNIYRNEPGE